MKLVCTKKQDSVSKQKTKQTQIMVIMIMRIMERMKKVLKCIFKHVKCYTNVEHFKLETVQVVLHRAYEKLPGKVFQCSICMCNKRSLYLENF